MFFDFCFLLFYFLFPFFQLLPLYYNFFYPNKQKKINKIIQNIFSLLFHHNFAKSESAFSIHAASLNAKLRCRAEQMNEYMNERKTLLTAQPILKCINVLPRDLPKRPTKRRPSLYYSHTYTHFYIQIYTYACVYIFCYCCEIISFRVVLLLESFVL